MNDVVYWLWLQKSLGAGAKIKDIITYYGSAKELYKAGETSWRADGFFDKSLFNINPKKLESMKSVSLSECEATALLCQRNNIEIITPESEFYPVNLKRINDYPAVLFVKGDLSSLNSSLPIAVIGTRNPSAYGIRAAEIISRDLAKKNTLIVSGGALGIDSIAHQSAIEEGSKTILVMGCGHCTKYLEANSELRQNVCSHGALITEYPPTAPATVYNFPARNRIISGISKGVVIIEASEKSGTLNTASHAKRQGRDIFAVPGDISSIAYKGSNKLITQGATAVFSAADILKFYVDYVSAMDEIEANEPKTPFEGIDKFDYGLPKKIKTGSSPRKKQKPKNQASVPDSLNEQKNEENINFNLENVSENAKLVYNHMLSEELSLDDITRSCSLPVRKVLVSLTELEMAGAVVSCGAGRYRRA